MTSIIAFAVLAGLPALAPSAPFADPSTIVRAATILSVDRGLIERLDVLDPREPMTFKAWSERVGPERLTWIAWGEDGVIGIDRKLPQIARLENEAKILEAFGRFDRETRTSSVASLDPAALAAIQSLNQVLPEFPSLDSPGVRDARVGFDATTMITIQGRDRSISLQIPTTLDDDSGRQAVPDSDRKRAFEKILAGAPLRPVALTQAKQQEIMAGARESWRSDYRLEFTFLGTAPRRQIDGTLRATEAFAQGLKAASEKNRRLTEDLYARAGFRLFGHTPADEYGKLSAEDQRRLLERVENSYEALGFSSREQAAEFLRTSQGLSYTTWISLAWCSKPSAGPRDPNFFGSVSIGRMGGPGGRSP